MKVALDCHLNPEISRYKQGNRMLAMVWLQSNSTVNEPLSPHLKQSIIEVSGIINSLKITY